jgi:hypothetical protein
LSGVGIGLKRTKRVGVLLGGVLVTIGIAIGLTGLGTMLDNALTEPSENKVPAGAENIKAEAQESIKAGAEENIRNLSRQTSNLTVGDSAQVRGVTRETAIQAFTQYPLLGVGPGNFGTYSSILEGKAIVNNEPLELLAETGILGLLSFTLFALSLLWLAIKVLARYGPSELPMVLALLLCVVGYSVQYQTLSTLYITHVWVTIGLLLGCVYVLRSPTTKPALLKPVRDNRDEPTSQKE